MSLSLTRFSWWSWSNGRDNEPVISSGSASDSMKLSSSKKKEAKLSSSSSSSSSRRVKKKWQSREERKMRVVDKEYDLVLVPSDGVCLSASDESSYDSDWSIGWMEPHGPDFYQGDDDDGDDDDVADNSFAVLVPCYRNDCKSLEMEEQSNNQFLNVLTAFPNGFPAEANKYMEQWLASLQNF